MRIIVAGHTAVTAVEFAELALGTPPELWLGVPGESAMERAARLDAAHDILADDRDMPDRLSTVAAEAIEAFAPDLFTVVPLPTPRRRRPMRKGAAA